MDVRIDTGALTFPTFLVPGVTATEVDGSGGVDLALDPGGYVIQQASGVFTELAFTVSEAGTVDYDVRLDAIVGGRGTPTMTVHGTPVTIDLSALSHALLPDVLGAGLLAGGQVHQLRLVPAPVHRFIAASGVSTDLVFGVSAAGDVVLDPRCAGFASATGAALDVRGCPVTLDTSGLSHDLAPQLLGHTGGQLAPGRHTLTVVPAPDGYRFTTASGVTADFRLVVDVDGTVLVDPRFAGFASATGPDLALPGYRIILDTTALAEVLVPHLLGFSGSWEPGRHTFGILPGAGYPFIGATTAVRLRVDVDGRPALEDASTPVEVFPADRFCAEPDAITTPLQVQTYGAPKGRWSRGALSVSIDTTGGQVVDTDGSTVPAADVAELLRGVLLQWQGVTSFFRFDFVAGDGDIDVKFGGKELNRGFGEVGGVSGFGPRPETGLVALDSAEPWTPNFLRRVALHEVGHCLGLAHSDTRKSIMFPSASNSSGSAATVIDDESRTALRRLYGWTPQRPLPDRATRDRPALAVSDRVLISGESRSVLHMAWRGSGDDDHLFEARLVGDQWSPQQLVPGRVSDQGPALSGLGLGDGSGSTGLVMAWRGRSGDQGLYVATDDGSGWTGQQNVPGAGSSHRPAVADFGGGPYLAWKGIDGDQGIYHARRTAGGWTAQRKIDGVGTAHAPALAVLHGELLLFWRGTDEDRQIYFTRTTDPDGGWGPQVPVRYPDRQQAGLTMRAIASTHGPAVARRADELVLAWKGSQGDSRVWTTVFDGTAFSGQIALGDAGTSEGPGVGVLGDDIHLVWKGAAENVLFTSVQQP